MNKVAKLVLIDPDDKYLLMYRSDHPTFGIDPDLPGGTLEEGETTLEAVIREVEEESGVVVESDDAQELYTGTDYSRHHTQYSLFVAHLNMRPEIVMSWEHSSYVWLDRDEFLRRSRAANDTFMHMVHDKLIEFAS